MSDLIEYIANYHPGEGVVEYRLVRVTTADGVVSLNVTPDGATDPQVSYRLDGNSLVSVEPANQWLLAADRLCKMIPDGNRPAGEISRLVLERTGNCGELIENWDGDESESFPGIAIFDMLVNLLNGIDHIKNEIPAKAMAQHLNENLKKLKDPGYWHFIGWLGGTLEKFARKLTADKLQQYTIVRLGSFLTAIARSEGAVLEPERVLPEDGTEGPSIA